jgi:hypothetical protein
MSEQLRPMRVSTRRVVEVGTAVWALVLAALLLVPDWHAGERSWWPWACVSGLVLGLIGYAYVARGRGNAADAE